MDNLQKLFLGPINNAAFSIEYAVFCSIYAFFMGIILWNMYKRTSLQNQNPQLYYLVILLPSVICMLFIAIDNEITKAILIAAVFFMQRLKNPKDVLFILLAAATGTLCGIGYLLLAPAFIFLLCLISLILYYSSFKKYLLARLKILIPESFAYIDVFDDTLKKHTLSYDLCKIKSTDMGSVFELHYSIKINKDTDVKQFMDDLRILNCNLSITLTMI